MFDRFTDFMNEHPLRWLGWYLVAMLTMILAAGAAMADDVTVSWTQPITNTNGSVIPATGAGSIQSNRVAWGSCVGSAFGTQIGAQVIPAATSYTVPSLAPATYCFRVTAVNTYGNESLTSNVASRVVPAPTPNPPVVTTAVIAGMLQTPVYSITSAGGLSTLVGFADVGKGCSGPVLLTYRGAKFRQVARADVKMWGSTALRLAAPCA